MRQVRTLNRGAHILAATPGRLLDLMNQGHIELRSLEVFFLDEEDRMLDMGFLPDLKRIISHLPKRRQSLFFSATLPPRIIELAKPPAAAIGQRERYAEVAKCRPKHLCDANQPEEAQDVELNAPETDSINSEDSR